MTSKADICPTRSGAGRTLGRGRVRTLVGLIFIALSAGGCRVTGSVDVDVRPNGSGKVTVTATLDAEAAKRVGDPSRGLRLEDLAAGGWKITPPTTRPDGGFSVSATKEFSAPERLQPTLAEIDSAFKDFSVGISNEFGRTRYRVTGTLDLSGGLARYGDADLTAALDGLPLGRTPAELAVELGSSPDAFRVEFHTRLPGSVQRVGDAPEITQVDSGAESSTAAWSASVPVGSQPADVAPIRIRIDTTVNERQPLLLLTIGAGCAVAAIALLVGMRLRRRRRAIAPRR